MIKGLLGNLGKQKHIIDPKQSDLESEEPK